MPFGKGCCSGERHQWMDCRTFMKLLDMGQEQAYAEGTVVMISSQTLMVKHLLNIMTKKQKQNSMSSNKNSDTMSVRYVNGNADRL